MLSFVSTYFTQQKSINWSFGHSKINISHRQREFMIAIFLPFYCYSNIYWSTDKTLSIANRQLEKLHENEETEKNTDRSFFFEKKHSKLKISIASKNFEFHEKLFDKKLLEHSDQ